MDATHDDDAFHLFGGPPAPASPDVFELFPQAPAPLPSAVLSAVDVVTERVATLELKPAPTLELRAMAPPSDADGGDSDGDFDLFPPVPPTIALAGSDSTVAAADVSDGLRSSRSTSAAAAAANVAAFSRARSLSAVVATAAAVNGTPLSPVHKMSGNAVDVIAVRSTEDQFFTTPWHVRLSLSCV